MVTIAGLVACAGESGTKLVPVLTGEAAIDRLLATEHFAEVDERIPAPLICYIEGGDTAGWDLYLGENHPAHTVRVGTYRVTRDGKAWFNADPTLTGDRWIEID